MKGKIEWIRVSAVVHSTEDREKVGEAISTLFPFEFEIAVSKAKGHYGNPMEYLEVELTKSSEIKKFWAYFLELLGEQVDEILKTIDEKIDDQNVLHIRIDKQKAYLGEVELTSGGDPIAVKLRLVTFPSKREKIIEFAKELCTTS
ncbi:MAG: exosome subunit [Archaeoglobus sp.]|uniref:RNA-binding domain-containing protein n=1 Tax=Archaeoglobus sp. TaxID=1872626 RepID=UPI001DF8E82A|nr:RNA-binding domain-containing protein [Archaeoglobus sp.]MBO8179205.1 exosome subunit [Archaeoglobus sp.]